MRFSALTTIATFIVSASLFAGAPAASLAADCSVSSPTTDQYCPPSTTTERGSDPSGGGLPFTGYDAGLAGLAAAALIGAGFGLRRVARTEEGT